MGTKNTLRGKGEGGGGMGRGKSEGTKGQGRVQMKRNRAKRTSKCDVRHKEKRGCNDIFFFLKKTSVKDGMDKGGGET